jgi:LacI family transcriptional regulator
MRQRVLDAASEIGYRQRVMVDNPMVTDLKTIGLLTKRRNGDALVINPFYSYIIAGAEQECSHNSIGLMYANIEVDEHSHASSLPVMLLDERVEGAIVVGAFLEETISHISQRAGQNIVLVDAYTSTGNEFDSVLIDNVNGAMTAVTYLIKKGHRQIGIIGSEANSYPSIQERRQGYLSAMAAHDLEPFIEDSSLYRDSAYDATLRLISRHPQVTAIFACNDNVAMGVMNALHDCGLKVPETVSVIGFDDIDIAQEVKPALTTMHVDKVLMGVTAVRYLIDRSLDPERTTLKTLVVPELIERDSVRCLEG